MRQFEVAPGGHTPKHSHGHEHEVFVLEGIGRGARRRQRAPVAAGHGRLRPAQPVAPVPQHGQRAVEVSLPDSASAARHDAALRGGVRLRLSVELAGGPRSAWPTGLRALLGHDAAWPAISRTGRAERDPAKPSSPRIERPCHVAEARGRNRPASRRRSATTTGSTTSRRRRRSPTSSTTGWSSGSRSSRPRIPS